MKKSQDVLIVGGGPAGLLLASKLSPRNSVMLIDRGKVGETNKYWITNRERLAQHELASHIRHETDGAIIGTFLGNPTEIPGNFVVSNERTLMSDLRGRCVDQQVDIKENTVLEAIHWTSQGISAQASGKVFHPRLLIDAAGGSSPLVTTFRLQKIYGFFSIIASKVSGLKLNQEKIIAAHITRLGYPPAIIEIAPVSMTSAFVAVFTVTKRAVKRTVLVDMFDKEVFENPFFSFDPLNGRVSEPVLGVIPIGRRERRRLPFVIGFGEAGMFQGPLLGGAFNEVLVYADWFVEKVEMALRGTRSDLRRLRIRLPHKKVLNDALQLFLARYLINGSAERLEFLVRLIERIGGAEAYKLTCSSAGTASILVMMVKALIGIIETKLSWPPQKS